MTFLKYYSAIWITFSTAVVFVDWVNTPDDAVSLIAFVLMFPVAWYTIALIVKK